MVRVINEDRIKYLESRKKDLVKIVEEEGFSGVPVHFRGNNFLAYNKDRAICVRNYSNIVQITNPSDYLVGYLIADKFEKFTGEEWTLRKKYEETAYKKDLEEEE